jgi:hypothetical protein
VLVTQVVVRERGLSQRMLKGDDALSPPKACETLKHANAHSLDRKVARYYAGRWRLHAVRSEYEIAINVRRTRRCSS